MGKGYVEGFFERGIVCNSDGSRIANSVKRIFGLFVEIPYLVGTLGSIKVKESCQLKSLKKFRHFSMNDLHNDNFQNPRYSRGIAAVENFPECLHLNMWTEKAEP